MNRNKKDGEGESNENIEVERGRGFSEEMNQQCVKNEMRSTMWRTPVKIRIHKTKVKILQEHRSSCGRRQRGGAWSTDDWNVLGYSNSVSSLVRLKPFIFLLLVHICLLN